jgi:hypothetical protein
MKYLPSLTSRCLVRGLVIIVVLLFTACDRQTNAPPDPSVPGEVRTFTGKWSATGNRQIMQLEPGHQAAIFRVTGTLLLEGKERLKKGFKADMLGFFDSLSGMQGRSVWTDERGDKVFSELHGDMDFPNSLITGRFLGGTGRYGLVTGEYTFKWKRLTNIEYGKVSGRVVDLQGWARLGAAAAAPGTIEDRQ